LEALKSPNRKTNGVEKSTFTFEDAMAFVGDAELVEAV
jgi:hypothetical protein